MTGIATHSQRAGARQWVTAFVPLTLLGLMWWFAGWTGPGQASAAPEAAWLLMASSWPAALWMLAAIGLGLPLRAWLLKDVSDGFPLQVGLGIAALLTLDAALGAIGGLQLGGGLIAWGLVLVGCVTSATQFAKWLASKATAAGPPLLVWTSLPALAVLLIAACSAPGWLWSTEFGGYDAMSYHLQLPREWHALGAIEPLQHNVYSFLPGYMEAAYYHITVLRGGSIDSVYACQFLHTGMAVMAAWITGRAARRVAGEFCGAVALVLMLGTPWVIVTGSLAYNEMATALMLSCGLLTAMQERCAAAHKGIVIGLLAGVACGAKLTAVGFVAIPLAWTFVMTTDRRGLLKAAFCGTACGLLVLVPWLLRNWSADGNPVFPFFTDAFGLGHWTAEQAATWARGHTADASVSQRMMALWNQLMRFGMGENPSPGEPWKVQWLVLPWLAVLGVGVGMMRGSSRRWSAVLAGVLVIQIGFWLTFTHLQSRFLLPSVAPMSIAAALCFGPLLPSVASLSLRRLFLGMLGLGLLAWSSVPAAIFRKEAGGAPAAAIGAAAHFAGATLPGTGETDADRAVFASAFVNQAHEISPTTKVLLIGESAPLYFDIDRIAYTTVWDRGVLSQLMRDNPDDPESWAQALHSQGFAFMLVNPGMLDRWQQSGWSDPNLSAKNVLEFAQRFGRLKYRFPRGELLFEIEPPMRPTETVPRAAGGQSPRPPS